MILETPEEITDRSKSLGIQEGMGKTQDITLWSSVETEEEEGDMFADADNCVGSEAERRPHFHMIPPIFS